MIRKIIHCGIFFLFLLNTLQTTAQCKVSNQYFQAGEELTYDLYFKYGLVNTKAGISSLKTISERYNGKDAYKMTLMAKSTGMANKIFTLADTLSCYMTKDLMPLAFLKNAKEGDDYTIENTTYTYNANGVFVNTKRTRNGKFRFNETLNSKTCIYDMMSIVYYARTLNYTAMKKGETASVTFLSGKSKVDMDIEYQGTETMKANDGINYNCFVLTLKINDKAFENKKEAMKVYLTNDGNRMPVRIDSKLNVGSTRAILKSYKGNKHTVKTD